MSWEEDYRRQYSCPCGKGEYEEITYSDDWGRSETHYKMHCSDCKEKYVYSQTIVYGHIGNEIERGWVLKSVLEAEKKYRKDVETKARELYYDLWKTKFINLKTKKQIWCALTFNGTYYPSLGIFYNHTKGYTNDKLIEYVNSFFNYNNLKQVFEVCNVIPDWKFLEANEEDVQRFHPDS